MPLLRGCCSLDLQLGTKIIGVICLIFAILGFVSTGIICAALAILQDEIVNQIRTAFPPDDGTIDRPFLTTSTNSRNLDPFLNDDDYNQTMDKQGHEMANYIANNMSLVLVVFLVILGQQLLEIFINSLVIHAIRKNRRGLLVPWIVMHILYVIVELGLIVLFITLVVYVNGLYRIVLPMIAMDLVWMAIHVYFILVVISQYQALGLIRMHDEMSMNLK